MFAMLLFRKNKIQDCETELGEDEMIEEIIEKSCKLIKQNSGEGTYCVLGLMDHNGYPTMSTITASQSDGINCITFCTGLNSRKSKRINNCNLASVCFNSDDYSITLVGTIEILTDLEIKKEMWYGGLINHFSGPEDPNYCVLRLKTERYNLFVDWEEVTGTLD